MGDIERGNVDMMHRMQTTFNGSNQQFLSTNQFDVSQLNASQIMPHLPQDTQILQNFSFDNNNNNNSKNGSNGIGIQPLHLPVSPFSKIPVPRTASHSRSLTQPSSFFDDSLPPLFPPLFQIPSSTPNNNGGENMNNLNSNRLVESSNRKSVLGLGNSVRITEGPPPRKLHRRTVSEVPFGFNSIPATAPVNHNIEGDAVVDEMLSSFINLDSIEALNSSVDSRGSGSKTNGCDSSENEAESCMNESGSAPVAAAARHNRSVSDSFMANMNFVDKSAQRPPIPDTGVPQVSLTEPAKLTSNLFSLGLGYRHFTADDMKKITSSEKLSEIVMTDPRRAKRILANRQSAARSKERKMKYISELEQKVQTLESESTTLSTKVTSLQRDSTELANQNHELKIRLRSLEQQSLLQNSLNVALSSEAQRLRILTVQLNQTLLSQNFEQQLYIDPQTFQFQQQLLNQNMMQGMNNGSTQPN